MTDNELIDAIKEAQDLLVNARAELGRHGRRAVAEVQDELAGQVLPRGRYDDQQP